MILSSGLLLVSLAVIIHPIELTRTLRIATDARKLQSAFLFCVSFCHCRLYYGCISYDRSLTFDVDAIYVCLYSISLDSWSCAGRNGNCICKIKIIRDPNPLCIENRHDSYVERSRIKIKYPFMWSKTARFICRKISCMSIWNKTLHFSRTKPYEILSFSQISFKHNWYSNTQLFHSSGYWNKFKTVFLVFLFVLKKVITGSLIWLEPISSVISDHSHTHDRTPTMLAVIIFSLIFWNECSCFLAHGRDWT